MDAKVEKFFTISDLYKAYRKAKTDAFFDKTHFNSIAFANYEQKLDRNLDKLLSKLDSGDASWCRDVPAIGRYSHLPKSVDPPDLNDSRVIHYATLDPITDWEDQCKRAGVEVEANFRLIIVPTVEYLVISALWIIKVGHKYDAALDRNLTYAHSLRRIGKFGPIAEDAHSLFVPYITGYRQWRSRGLKAMRSALEGKKAIAAVTMDVQRFYHNISPNFLLHRKLLQRLNISLDGDELNFTRNFVRSINAWYATTPDSLLRPEGALPVGLTASRIISNVLLAEFDRVLASKTKAIYYGRYADDLFLVVAKPKGAKSGEDFIQWLRKKMDGWLVLQQQEEGSGLRLRLPYAKESKIVFASAKQKIFYLHGEHGLDLLDHLSEKIREQSSEYRQLPELPTTESEMAAKALLASPDARLEADALRKAEAVSIRRFGFSMLLSEVESYSHDLAPKEWRSVRHKFYGLVFRYVLTPMGIFDYFVYTVRVFGLMIACGDLEKAEHFLKHFDAACSSLEKTTSAGTTRKSEFNQMQAHYRRGFYQVALAASSSAHLGVTKRFRTLVAKLQRRKSVASLIEVRTTSVALLKADLARRPYHDYWFNENPNERKQPKLPNDFSVRRVLALTKRFRGRIKGGLNAPFWPAIAFATRPVPVWSLCINAPLLLAERGGLQRALWATRGARVNPAYRDWSFIETDEEGRREITVPSIQDGSRKFGVPSYLMTDAQWEQALSGFPNGSLARYVGIKRLINRMLKESPGISYIAFPECSIRLDWALPIAQKLGSMGVSLIAGLENRGSKGNYTNEALVSLSSNFFGTRGALCFIQPKIELACHEAVECLAKKKVFKSPSLSIARPIYIHAGMCFGVLICSDLTTIDNRAFFQGHIDTLFVLEWNRDISTFEFLVESAAHDLHAAIVQINNRAYGDSRIRMPFADSFRRDVVQVKGGDEDFFVVSSINIGALRAFQRNSGSNDLFKPLPIGYRMSSIRHDSILHGKW